MDRLISQSAIQENFLSFVPNPFCDIFLLFEEKERKKMRINSPYSTSHSSYAHLVLAESKLICIMQRD